MRTVMKEYEIKPTCFRYIRHIRDTQKMCVTQSKQKDLEYNGDSGESGERTYSK